MTERSYPAPALSLRDITAPATAKVGTLRVDVRPNPLTVVVTNAAGQPVQTLVFEPDGNLSFGLDGQPVLGMGEGGPLPAPGSPWRSHAVQFDRRGQLDLMEPRWQADMYGSRNPAAMLLGTGGWGLFVATPWVQVDLRRDDRGLFIPYKPPSGGDVPQTRDNQRLNLGKGVHPVSAIVPGLYDLFVFDAHEPAKAMRDFAVITGPAAMPPRWALGYMQSHRTLEDDAQMLGIIDTFRARKIPLDAVIYLGTGFCPRGWNTPQPSFDFNPEVFKRDPKQVLADMHARNVKVAVHIVPWDRDQLPTLHGSIPAKPGETLDASHIQNYWKPHAGLVAAGVDAFWPDEGDWFNLFERIKRHQLYYEGGLSTTPNVRPWSLQRNGYPGIAKWGGWVWSGDTDSSWKTLEAQIAVGLNYSLSIGPFWGSDIGGFYPNNELTGELYARWHQFAAFCGSFRSHGRTWWLRLPWGWGSNEMGPREHNNTNAADTRGRPAQRPAVGDEQPRHRAGREAVLGAALPVDAVYLHPGVGSPPDGHAPDARHVAALSQRRRRAGARHAVHVGAGPADRAGLREGCSVQGGLPSHRDVVRLVDQRDARGRADGHPRRGSRHDADLRPGRSDHPVGPRPAVHEPGGRRAHDAPGVPRRGRPVHAVRGRRHQPGLPGGKRHVDPHHVERAERAADHRARSARRCDESDGSARIHRRVDPRRHDPDRPVLRQTRRRQVLIRGSRR